MHSHLAEIEAVLKKLADDRALRFDGLLLLDDEQRNDGEGKQQDEVESVTGEERRRLGWGRHGAKGLP
jgi:hypothetical protein